MKESLLIVSFILLILTGCANRALPVATGYPVKAQRKMQSAHHWDVLAKDLAERLKKTIDLSFPNAVVKPSVFIKYNEKTPFGKALFTLLTIRLIQQGLVIMDSNAQYGDNLVIEYQMQVVHHKDRRLTYLPPGAFTALATGVWFAAQIKEHWDYPGPSWSILPLAIGGASAFTNYYLPGETNTEVIISTVATMGQQYLFGDSRIYYINDDDYEHYEDFTTTTTNKTYRIVNQ
ncbi:MAG: hypothetical protein KAI83_19195 [Thiomargarita sp.]|jgi:hypothetical protein|nr:hypothetical protein [Thiomargarita sp.]